MIVLKNHTISKRGSARLIIIKKEFEKAISKYQDEDVLLTIGRYQRFNSRVSFSKPYYYINIRPKHAEKLKKYFNKEMNIIIELSKK